MIFFSGSSDDLVGISGAPGADELHADRTDGEYNVLSQQSRHSPLSGIWRLQHEDQQCYVVALLFRNAVWSFSVLQIDEDIPLPDWPISLRQDPHGAYSTQLSIEAPEGTRIIFEPDAQL